MKQARFLDASKTPLTGQFEDEGYAENSPDLDQLHCELNAYQNFQKCGVSDHGFVLKCHGYIDRFNRCLFGEIA